jgi:WD40-like Beta Propeller Repeat
MPTMVRAGRRASLAVLLAASWCALAAPTPQAAADTGGRTLTYTTGHAFVATAAHPMRRHRLPIPRLPHTDPGTVQDVVPSPDGRRLAQAFDFFVETRHHLWLFTALVVTDRRGGHQQLVWRETRSQRVGIMWMQGMSWSADGRRLYFAPFVRDDSGAVTTRLLSARIRPASTGPVSRVPHSTGLAWPATDPTGKVLAAVRAQGRWCVRPGAEAKPRSASLVVVHPRTGAQRELTTITTEPATCATAIEELAWSPDGTSIAFDTEWSPESGRDTADISVVSAHGAAPTPSVVVSGMGKHVATSPAWQSARTLWFQWKPVVDNRYGYDSTSNLFSTRREQGVFQPMVQRTHIVKYARRVFDPSFG